MANILQIKAQLSSRPFRPFWPETTGGSRIRVGRPEWFYEAPYTNGEFVVFGEGVMHVANYRDLLDTMIVEQPPPPGE